MRELAELIADREKPGVIVSDTGTELIGNKALAWCGEMGVEGPYIELGPVDKGDSQEGQYLIQGGFWGGYRDPGFDERRGMGLP